MNIDQVLLPESDDLIGDAQRDGNRARTWTAAEATQASLQLAALGSKYDGHTAVWAYMLYKSGLLVDGQRITKQDRALGRRSGAEWGALANVSGQSIGQRKVVGTAIVELGMQPGTAELRAFQTVRRLPEVTAALRAVAEAGSPTGKVKAVRAARKVIAQAQTDPFIEDPDEVRVTVNRRATWTDVERLAAWLAHACEGASATPLPDDQAVAIRTYLAAVTEAVS